MAGFRGIVFPTAAKYWSERSLMHVRAMMDVPRSGSHWSCYTKVTRAGETQKTHTTCKTESGHGIRKPTPRYEFSRLPAL